MIRTNLKNSKLRTSIFLLMISMTCFLRGVTPAGENKQEDPVSWGEMVGVLYDLMRAEVSFALSKTNPILDPLIQEQNTNQLKRVVTLNPRLILTSTAFEQAAQDGYSEGVKVMLDILTKIYNGSTYGIIRGALHRVQDCLKNENKTLSVKKEQEYRKLEELLQSELQKTTFANNTIMAGIVTTALAVSVITLWYCSGTSKL